MSRAARTRNDIFHKIVVLHPSGFSVRHDLALNLIDALTYSYTHLQVNVSFAVITSDRLQNVIMSGVTSILDAVIWNSSIFTGE